VGTLKFETTYDIFRSDFFAANSLHRLFPGRIHPSVPIRRYKKEPMVMDAIVGAWVVALGGPEVILILSSLVFVFMVPFVFYKITQHGA